ncbi:MAG: polysaccharide biosynthesis protein [Myxococcaceae bacterium]|nr:polysaccharide biosynthesis protein [Myxococcaceae bacterium]
MSEPAESAKREAGGVGVNLLTLMAQASMPAFQLQISRFLGQDAYGLYALCTSIVDPLSGITMFGMDLATTRAVSLAHAEGDPARAARATGGALRVVVASGVLVALCIAVAAPFIAARKHDPALMEPLRLLALMPIGYHVASVFLIATQAKMVMKYDFWARGLFQPLVLLALATAAIHLGGGVLGVCAAVVAAMSLTAVLAARFFGREFPLGVALRTARGQPVDRALLRMGAPMVVLGLVWNLQGAVDLWALAAWRSDVDVGAYKACLIWVVSLSQVRNTFAPVINATLPPLLARNDVAAVNAFIRRQNRWVALLAMPLCVLFAGFGEGLLYVFGRGFLIGVPALAILALGNLAGALAVPAYVLLLGGKARYSTLAGASCLIFQLVSLPILVPRYGITGAALASASGMVLSQLVQQGFTWRLARVHGFSVGLAKVAAAALAGLVVGRLAYAALPALIPVRFFGGVGVAAVVYLAALVALGLHPDEIDVARSALAQARALATRLRR